MIDLESKIISKPDRDSDESSSSEEEGNKEGLSLEDRITATANIRELVEDPMYM